MKTLLLICLFFASHQLLANDLILSVGEEKKISLPAGSRVWIEKKGILKAQSKASSILLRGLKIGSTQARWGTTLQTIHVISNEDQASFKSILKAQESMLGVQFLIVDGKIHLQGSLFSKKYYDQTRLILGGSPFQLAAQMPLQVEKEILAEIQLSLKKKNLPLIYIQRHPQWQIYLPTKDSRLSDYRKALEPFGVSVFADASAISSQPLIRIQVTVAEVKREFSRKWGVQWPETLSAQILPRLAEALDPAYAQLNFIENHGNGRVLASPTLLVKSGDEASFHAGGEIPIKIVNIRSQNVEWKSYGIQLKVKTKSDLSGRIELEIDTRVSNIIAAATVDGIPSLSTHQVKSTFSVNEPRTIILSGLIRNEDAQSSQGLPGLGQLPIIGTLFSSKDFRENRSELLIFVRPEIVQEQDSFQNSHLGDSL